MNKNKSFYESFKRIAFAFCAVLLGIFGVANAATLPSGYTQLEYIESSGTQWIDSGVKFSTTDTIEAKVMATSSGTKHFVSSGGGASNPEFFQFAQTSSVLLADFGEYSTGRVSTSAYTAYDNAVTLKATGDGKFYVDGNLVGTSGGTFVGTVNTIALFGPRMPEASIRIYSFSIEGKINLVPAQTVINGETVNGMYDTVENHFYRSAASGTNFTAGPATCRNLFDASTVPNKNEYVVADGGFLTSPSSNNYWRHSDYIEVTPSTRYVISGITFASAVSAGLAWYNQNKVYISGLTSSGMNSVNGVITAPANAKYIRFSWSLSNNSNWEDSLQFEQGSTATDYVPYCSTPIKIATTKYNEDAFANLVTTLNSAITKVTNIVDTTVAQASSIGTLATTKQDRPADGDCPAGRKCLLVTGTDGKPHWYLIQE